MFLLHLLFISLAPSPVFLTELTLINVCCINELVQVTQPVSEKWQDFTVVDSEAKEILTWWKCPERHTKEEDLV